MSKVTVLGFTGGMGTGKSTIVQYLAQKPGTSTRRFAGPLYEIQEMIYRRIRAVIPTPSPLKDRKLLQWIGTDWGRERSPTLWIDLWRKEVFPELALNRVVLVEDVRFDNEAEAIRALGGRVIRVTAGDKALAKRDVVRKGIEGHASEAGINSDLVDFTLENNGSSLKELHKKLDMLFEDLDGEWV